MSSHTAARDRPPDDGRAVVILRNDTTTARAAAVVLAGDVTITRHARLAPVEVGAVAAATDGPVTAAVHADDASASFSFDPETAAVPPVFSLRDGRVLVASK
jgi:mRNA-degrading endonuclease toxin of MazEF toxin-antitoxin module